MSNLGIGQLAKRAGVAIDTVRYYERNHLLTPSTRLASGYLRYGDAELKRLRFIRRAKALGFTLEDIRGLLRDTGRVLLDAEMDAPVVEEVREVVRGCHSRLWCGTSTSGGSARANTRAS